VYYKLEIVEFNRLLLVMVFHTTQLMHVEDQSTGLQWDCHYELRSHIVQCKWRMPGTGRPIHRRMMMTHPSSPNYMNI